MKVLVTGADGFVGRHVVDALIARGHAVIGTCRKTTGQPRWSPASVEWSTLELDDEASIQATTAVSVDAVLHLAAIASGREARRAVAAAWTINTVGTVRLLEAYAANADARMPTPRILVVSTGEVYGAGPARPLTERDEVRPASPYAASKAAAEVGALEIGRRTQLPVIVARPFSHTGPGQTDAYVAPSFASRLRDLKRSGGDRIRTGNLKPIRDFLDVRDVAAAYVALLERGMPGEIYNIGSGTGVSLADLLAALAAIVGVVALADPDPELMRTSDIPFLVGDATKLRSATGWAPRYTLDQTLRDLVDAQGPG